MNVRRRHSQLVSWLLTTGALVVGLVLGVTAGEMPEPPGGLTAVKPPTPMTAFALPSLQGGALDASSLKDKVVVVRFWATW